MWAVILAGGLGLRLRSSVPGLPKALAPVGGRPFLDYQLEYAVSEGIRTVVLCTGYLSDRIASHVGDARRFGLQVLCVPEEAPLGTAGAIRGLSGTMSLPDAFFVLNGDTWVGWNAELMTEVMATSQAGIVMLLSSSSVPETGRVSVDGSGRVTGFQEKISSKTAGYVNAGVYLMRRQIVEAWEPQPSSLEYDRLPPLVEQGNVHSVVGDRPFYDIGTPEGIERFECAVLAGKVRTPSAAP